VLVALAIAAAAAVVAASLRPEAEVPAPGPPLIATVVDDAHGTAAGPTTIRFLMARAHREVSSPDAVPAGSGLPSPTIGLGVSSTPPGADVLLDGRMIGRTPLVETVPRAAGTATLKLRLARHQDYTATVDLGADSNVDVKLVPLPPPPARVTKVQPARPCNGETDDPSCKVVKDGNEPALRESDLVARAIAKSQAGDHAGAIELYNRASPETHPILLSSIATEYEQSGDMAKALRYYCSYLARDPGGASASYAADRARLLYAVLEPEGGNESEKWEDICTAAATDQPRHIEDIGVGKAIRCKHHECDEPEPPK
jgi:hypothetical protein